tara:strand:- start:208 stop:495 length:288 start_codon:yes stop_codon:yes gene_type:complete
MKAYVIAQIEVTNEDGYKEYLKKVTTIVNKYKGKYIVRAGKFKLLLGECKYKRNVVIEFPNFELAEKWYDSDEYLPIRKIREKNSKGNLIIIEGA